MIILGIDPAIRCTGYGVIEMKSINDFRIIDCGIIRNKPKVLHSECLRRLAGGFKELIEAFSPDVASIEEAFYGKNINTSMILSMARGAIIATLAEHGIPVYSYSPRTAKRAVTGSGAASKEQIASLMSSMTNIDISGIPMDSTDALALALCHGQIAVRPELSSLLPEKI